MKEQLIKTDTNLRGFLMTLSTGGWATTGRHSNPLLPGHSRRCLHLRQRTKTAITCLGRCTIDQSAVVRLQDFREFPFSQPHQWVAVPVRYDLNSLQKPCLAALVY